MRIPRIYSVMPLAGRRRMRLDDGAARHVGQVLRMKVGAELYLFDGHGGQYLARIVALSKREVSVDLLAHQDVERESVLSVHLLQGVSRGERMDWVMQKAVELGVAEITPLLTERCGVSLSDQRWRKRMRHWQGVIASACEQCGRNRLPRLHAPQALDKVLSSWAGLGLVLNPGNGRRLGDLGPPPEGRLGLLIGPEGGLAAREVMRAEQAGFVRISLGARILRTETAAVAALAVVQALWGDA